MPFGPIASILSAAIAFINVIVVPFIMAIAFLAFMWGVFQYFIAGGANEEKRTQGRNFIIWSVIGFFLIFSIWGIVGVLMRSLGFGSQVMPSLPSFRSSSGAGGGYTLPGNGSGAPGSPCSDATDCRSGYCSMLNPTGQSLCQ